MKEALLRLGEEKEVHIISGSSREQMKYQLDGLEKFPLLALNGNDTDKWKNELSALDQFAIYKHITEIAFPLNITSNIIENRGCQISYSLLGHDAPFNLKKDFDPDGSLRRSLLKQNPFSEPGLKIKIGGTTCFDYFQFTKGENLFKMFGEKSLIYVGDSLFPEGNDESVMDYFPYVSVKSPEETLLWITNQLSHLTNYLEGV